MASPLDRLKARRAAVLSQPASLHKPVDPKLEAYLDKVAHRAYSVTDDDVKGLVSAGRTEDEIFERTVVCALDAAIERFAAGLGALREAEKATGEKRE